MTSEQKILMEKSLQSKEPIYLKENALASIIMKEYVFIEQGRHPVKSVLISHLKQKSGKSWALTLSQCSFERHYEDVEIKLFKKISEKILILLEKYMSNEKNKLEYINLEKSASIQTINQCTSFNSKCSTNSSFTHTIFKSFFYYNHFFIINRSWTSTSNTS